VASPVRATVDVTELMGNEIFLHLLIGDKPFLARVDPGTKARPGQEMQVVFNMAKMHAFDPVTEQAIVVSAAPSEAEMMATSERAPALGRPGSDPPEESRGPS